jgi:hypothetical protein
MVNFKQFPDSVQEVIRTNNGLKQALKRLDTGTPDTPRSWFYETKKPQWILDSIVSRLKVMKDLKLIADWDISKSEKFGPQGGSAPLKERLDTFEEYFNHLASPAIISDPKWKQAKLTAIQRLRFNEAGSPAASKAVVDRGMSEDKYNTNSGYPLFKKRKSPEAREEAIAESSTSIEKKFPCTLGTRATMGKTGKSARNIFMASMAVNVQGQRYQQPLQDYLRKLHDDFFLPWEGWDACQLNISKRWDDGLKFGADYTKMDQHFNLWHGLEVYDVIKHFFRRTYWSELESTIRYVFSVPIITNLGYVDQDHAMPSGSEWTNFLETLWNYIFTIYLEIKYHLEFSTKMGIGDDQLWILKGKWDAKGINWVTNIVIKEFELAGLPGNKDKQEVSMDKTGFLQRFMCSDWNGQDGKIRAAGVYSLVRNVTSQVYPERYHNEEDWDSDMFALRVIMIAENCCNHPEFKWYVQEFIAKSNPNILEWVRKSDAKLTETQRRAKNIANFLPTYNQEKQNMSILNFETVKLLRALH